MTEPLRQFRPPIPRLDLPPRPDWVPGCYWRPSGPFIDELSAWLAGQRVLELFAGNGYLAAWLKEKGISITPTTRFTGHDGHESGVYCDIVEVEACEAVASLGAEHDVLLICWPTVTPAVLRAALLWGPERPIVFIGEMTDLQVSFYGGCAADEFFERMQVTHWFKTYSERWGEKACVMRLRDIPGEA